LDRQKYSELTDDKAREAAARLPRSDEQLTPQQRAEIFAESQRKPTARPRPEAALKAANERVQRALLELGAREVEWKGKLLRAAGASPRAKALADQLIRDYEDSVGPANLEFGIPGIRKLVEGIEAAQQENLNEITRIGNIEAEEMRKARDKAELEEADRTAQGMSSLQTRRWLESRGFILKLKKGVLYASPAGALTVKERAMARLHKAGIIALLTAEEDFVAID